MRQGDKMALSSSKKLKFNSTSAARPQTAVELSPEGVLAAASQLGGAPPMHAFVPLPAGALTPGIEATNIVAFDAVVAALRQALELVEPRSQEVSLIVPDSAVRNFVLDFDSLPQKRSDAVPVIRFRLRKMLPFDSELAAISYQVLEQSEPVPSGAPIKALVTVIPGPILAEYEAAVHAADYEAGAVLPSGLAALAALTRPEASLAANLSSNALTTSITLGNDLLLYRTVELPLDDANRTAEVRRSVAVAAAYFEDRLGMRPRQIYYSGPVSASDFARAVGNAELNLVAIVPPPATENALAAAPISLAAVAGALAGAV